MGEIERCQLELSPQDFFFSDGLDGSDSVVGVRYSVSLFVDIIFLSGNATQRRVFDRALGGVVAVLAGSCKIAYRLLCGGPSLDFFERRRNCGHSSIIPNFSKNCKYLHIALFKDIKNPYRYLRRQGSLLKYGTLRFSC